MSSLGNVLKQIRLDMGLSRANLAVKLSERGLRVSTRFGVQRIEERGTKKYDVLKAYAEMSGKTLQDIDSLVDSAELATKK